MGRAGRPLIQLRSNEITEGFSGAPIWDKLKRRVIGIISDITKPDPHHRLVETAFAISTETLQKICPVLQISDICPYLGLTAFRETDAEFFFGRQQVIDSILNRLRQEPRFLTVLGPSGSGKSSILQAGVIFQLRNGKVPRSDRWGFIVTRPATNPFDELAKKGLADGKHNLTESVQAWLRQYPEQERLVLIFDQFEEVFITCSEALCQSFIEQLTYLLQSSSPTSVILVMRDDFYSHLTQHEMLVKWLEQSRGPLHIPQVLKQDELTAMVQKPAEAIGQRFEEGLVEVIVRDTMEASVEAEDGGQAGRSTVLPLLEFAMSELWKRRQEGMLTHEAYTRIGTVVGALTQWADRAFFELKSEEQQQLAHRIFTDLIYLGDKNQGILDSRRRRTLLSLHRDDSEQQSVQYVVQHLVDNRLLVTDRDIRTTNDIVEIIHDVLLRTWGRLKHWIEEDHDFLEWHQKLEAKVQEWSETDLYHPDHRDVDKLLGKRDLIVAKEWQEKRKGDLGLPEHTFIEVSKQRQHKIENRRGILFTVLSVLSIVAIVLASVAEINFQRAQAQSRLAAMQKAVATSRQLATQATNHLDDNLDLALLLSVEANRIQSTPEARDSLLRALEHQPHLATLLTSLSAGSGNSIAFSPDGKMLAVGGQNQTFTLWDVASRRPLLPPIRDQLIPRNDTVGQVPIPVNSLAFSPDGKILATGTSFFGGTFRLWDVQSKQLISPPISVPRGVTGLSFNPMGNILAVGSTNGTFSLWNVASQRLLSTHRSWTDVGDPHPIYSDLVFSPDGQFLAVGNNDIGFSLPATFTLWDMRSQQLLGTHLMGGSSLWGNSLSFSLDSKILAVGGDNGSAALWNVKSQSPLGVSLTNTNISKVDAPTSGFIPDSSLVAFSPAGRILAVGSSSGTITLWDTATHQLVDEIKTNSSLADMIFSPDGSLLATIGDGSYTATLKGSYIGLWHVLPIQPLAQLMIGASKSVKPAFRPDGTVLGLNGGYDTAVSPDGHTIAMKYCSDGSCTDPTIRIWSMVSRQQMGGAFTGFPPGMGMGPAIALSPHATFLAVAGCHTQGCTSGELQIWNVATHQFLGNPILTDLPLGRVAYSQDGKILAAYGDHILGNSSGDMIYLWDGATGRFLGSISSIESYGRSFVFMSDNDTLIAPYCAQFSKDACDHIQIGLWDSQNPTNRKRIINDAGMQSPDYLLLSPRGDILVASDQNNIAFLWDIANSKLIAKLDVSYPFTYSVFTPDGTMLFTGSQLLDINTLTPVGPSLSVYTNYLPEEMQTSDDTNPLYGWSIRDGLVVSWDFNVDSWQTLACQMANRNLTLSEWKQFIVSMPYSKICPSLPGPTDEG